MRLLRESLLFFKINPYITLRYRMYSYIAKELPQVISANLPVNMERQSVSGHSMGGSLP